MKKKDIFDVSMIGGFNKVEVIKYMDEIHKEKEDLLKELYKEKETGKFLLNEKTEEKAKYVTKQNLLKNKQKDITIERLNVDELQNKIKRIREKRDNLKNKVKERNDLDSNHKNSEDAERLLSETKKMATFIIDEAKKKSEMRIQKVSFECEKIKKEAHKKVDKINQDLQKFIEEKKYKATSIKSKYNVCNSELIKCLESIENSISNISGDREIK
ncbi:hypothetical protein NSA50_09615 [Clostridium sp. DSM 100503]|uniref:hypothetical protein n=1 Tax=Clostridium sp. DSM 100503 TaxID=2963282 RepID=UPI00214A4828|nr:hypothetical protein [Clostridium sp. DSM 100503]MCR1951306.1 hypothetical protein [Clostridium sp. DSM 100503]